MRTPVDAPLVRLIMPAGGGRALPKPTSRLECGSLQNNWSTTGKETSKNYRFADDSMLSRPNASWYLFVTSCYQMSGCCFQRWENWWIRRDYLALSYPTKYSPCSTNIQQIKRDSCRFATKCGAERAYKDAYKDAFKDAEGIDLSSSSASIFGTIHPWLLHCWKLVIPKMAFRTDGL